MIWRRTELQRTVSGQKKAIPSLPSEVAINILVNRYLIISHDCDVCRLIDPYINICLHVIFLILSPFETMSYFMAQDGLDLAI